MKIHISARSSDLARLQAYTVGAELQKLDSKIEVTYQFKKSLGDQNLDTPLWTMGNKGVFTEDFYEDLVQGKTDMVVHSWKDLPVQNREATEIIATLQREEVNDVMLVPKKHVSSIKKNQVLNVLSSSPRREYNLKPFLKWATPFNLKEVKFQSVRGNVPTRVRKLMEGEGDALIVAKAALDRLLDDQFQEFAETRKTLRAQIDLCLWMVLPLTYNPTAAAQGALAIEVNKANASIKALLSKINQPDTFELVQKERQMLAGYGGGCHQKIGVNFKKYNFGEMIFLKGLTDQGEILDKVALVESKSNWPSSSAQKIWPSDETDSLIYERKGIELSLEQLKTIEESDLFIARADAINKNIKLGINPVIWVSGFKTWQKLTQEGFWVNGSTEGLGEAQLNDISHLMGKAPNWLKLTHKASGESLDLKSLATYELIPTGKYPNLSGKTHFYWKSGSQFKLLLEQAPHIAEGYHACGPGNTYEVLKKYISDPQKIKIFLSFADWKNEVLKHGNGTF